MAWISVVVLFYYLDTHVMDSLVVNMIDLLILVVGYYWEHIFTKKTIILLILGLKPHIWSGFYRKKSSWMVRGTYRRERKGKTWDISGQVQVTNKWMYNQKWTDSGSGDIFSSGESLDVQRKLSSIPDQYKLLAYSVYRLGIGYNQKGTVQKPISWCRHGVGHYR